MRLIAAVVCVFVLFGCGDDDGSSGGDGGGWIEQWGDIPDGPDYQGQPTKVDETERVLYIEDCELAREATGSGGPYGPEGGEAGYAYICE